MFHCMINFSLITFICYAVAAPAKAIVGGGKAKKPRRAPVNTQTHTSAQDASCADVRFYGGFDCALFSASNILRSIRCAVSSSG